MQQKGTFWKEINVEVIKQAMQFLGNASSVISAERSCRVADYLNKDLRPQIKEEERFQDAQPFLFGNNLKQVVRDHA